MQCILTTSTLLVLADDRPQASVAAVNGSGSFRGGAPQSQVTNRILSLAAGGRCNAARAQPEMAKMLHIRSRNPSTGTNQLDCCDFVHRCNTESGPQTTDHLLAHTAS
ncbi:uncharacterized protein L3040_004238 [Drepanopeziza brunnea f. sp. 'multigermtubi']|uniref:uncharacterized protein n=1 Tax=Drepanopeziza brunnea f. sp. 'multigermtubi' TaxID=698441 RepID=UPI00238DE1F8|nr:hypothetical protein L3040_004238 [Drepanopeziza brunnea f. sp. 'multigermtubi']